MFDIGLQEMLIIGVIALLVFGPGKLPELGRKVGKLMREFRHASAEFRPPVETTLQLNEPEPAIQPPAPGLVSEPATATLPSEALPAIGDAAAATATQPAVEHREPPPPPRRRPGGRARSRGRARLSQASGGGRGAGLREVPVLRALGARRVGIA